MDALGRLIKFNERYQQAIIQTTATSTTTVSNGLNGNGNRSREYVDLRTPPSTSTTAAAATITTAIATKATTALSFSASSHPASHSFPPFPPHSTYGRIDSLAPLAIGRSGFTPACTPQWSSVPQWCPSFPTTTSTPTEDTSSAGSNTGSTATSAATNSVAAAALLSGYAAAAALPYSSFPYFPTPGTPPFGGLLQPVSTFPSCATTSNSFNFLTHHTEPLVDGGSNNPNSHPSTRTTNGNTKGGRITMKGNGSSSRRNAGGRNGAKARGNVKAPTNRSGPATASRANNCECPNCLELQSAGLPIDKKNERHSCHIPGCHKIYMKSSHLKAHLKWHCVERPLSPRAIQSFQKKRREAPLDATPVAATTTNGNSSDLISTFN